LPLHICSGYGNITPQKFGVYDLDHQLEVDFGLSEDASWDMAGDREVWMVQ